MIYFFLFTNRTAKRLLTEIVEKGRPTPFHNDGPGMSVQEIMIPASKAGLVIGKGGETIKQLQVSEDLSLLRPVIIILIILINFKTSPFCSGRQERAGVKMVMIQDGPQNTGADKPLRISGDPYKVQVSFPYGVRFLSRNVLVQTRQLNLLIPAS